MRAGRLSIELSNSGFRDGEGECLVGSKLRESSAAVQIGTRAELVLLLFSSTVKGFA